MLWELCALQKVPPTERRLRHRMLRRAGIDRDLVIIIDKALAREPADRYPDAGALAADLKAFKVGARIAARNYSIPAMLGHWTHRHRAISLAIVTVIIVGAIATALYIQNIRAERDLTRNELLTAQREQEVRAAKELAEARTTQSELEQGRAALLHGEPDAALHLRRAYRRDPEPSTAFMLARALQPRLAERAILHSSLGRMWSASFSPRGDRVVTSDDKDARIWDASTGRLLATLPHGNAVYSATYFADGAKIVSADADGIVRIWDARATSLMRTLRPPSGRPRYYSALASPDGSL